MKVELNNKVLTNHTAQQRPLYYDRTSHF